MYLQSDPAWMILILSMAIGASLTVVLCGVWEAIHWLLSSRRRRPYSVHQGGRR